jgi:hypothetical protein
MEIFHISCLLASCLLTSLSSLHVTRLIEVPTSRNLLDRSTSTLERAPTASTNTEMPPTSRGSPPGPFVTQKNQKKHQQHQIRNAEVPQKMGTTTSTLKRLPRTQSAILPHLPSETGQSSTTRGKEHSRKSQRNTTSLQICGAQRQ